MFINLLPQRCFKLLFRNFFYVVVGLDFAYVIIVWLQMVIILLLDFMTLKPTIFSGTTTKFGLVIFVIFSVFVFSVR